MRLILIAVIACIVYFQGVKPIVADYHLKRHNATKALEWSPDNTQILYENNQILKAIDTSNGDLTAYSMWYVLAVNHLRAKNLEGARKALQKSLWYYPNYEPAKDLMGKING